MANKNFVVQHGLTVGPLTIDAATGDINTSGNIVITGSLGVSQISKNDSSVSINDTGSSSTVTISIDGTTEHTVDADGVNLASGDRYAIAGTSVLNATTLGTAVVNSSLTTVGNLTSLSVAGDTSVYGNLTVQGLTTLNGGTLTLGDSNTDNVVFGADINSSLKPNGPDLDLGTNSSRWGNVYAITLDVTGNITGTLLTASQPNITSVGNLTSLSASGTIETTGIVYGNSGVSGTLLTASQPNITGVGNLTALSVAGDTTIYGNLTVQGLSTLNGGTLTLGDADTDNVVFGADVNSSIIPNIDAIYHLGGASKKWANIFATNLTGTIQTASQPNITGVGNLTSLSASGTIETTGIVYGNSGVSGTLLTASQPNITSVGNLTSLSASGTIETTGNVTATNLTGTLLTASQPNITTVGTLGTLAVTGNVTTGNVSGTNLTGTLLTASQPNITGVGTLGTLAVTGNVTTGNVSGTNLTGTLLTASQTNITQVGNLTALTVAGAVNVTTSLTVDGSAYGNVVTTQFGSLFATAYGPNNYSILQAWSAPTGGALGMQAFGNIIYSSGEINFSTGKTIKDKDYPTGGVTKVTITAAGDLWANATTPSTSTTTGALVVGGGAGIAGNINAGNVIATNLTGTLLTASQTNVTSVGVLTSLAVTGNVTVGSGSATGVVTSKGSYDLTLTTNDTGASAPKITLIQSDDGNIQLDPSGTGVVTALSHLYVGNGSTEANISSLGAYNLLLSTNRDLSRATIKLSAGTNGNIDFSLNGSGTVNIPGITFGGGGTQVKAAIIGGSDTYIQYNSGGDFGGSANLTFNDVTNQITVGGAIVATTDDATALAIALG